MIWLGFGGQFSEQIRFLATELSMSQRLNAPARSPLRRSNLNLGQVSSPLHAAPSKSGQKLGWVFPAPAEDLESDVLRKQAEALDRVQNEKVDDSKYETEHLSVTFQKFWQVISKAVRA